MRGRVMAEKLGTGSTIQLVVSVPCAFQRKSGSDATERYSDEPRFHFVF